VLFSHGSNKVFLVPDSCRTTERNSNSISADVKDDVMKTIRMTLVSAIFTQFASSFGLFDIAG